MNQTMAKFGFPESVVSDYQHWVLLLRPHQVTLGSLALVAKPDATRASDLSSEAFTEMGVAIRDIERTLSRLFSYDKINYLALMMVDPNVHFHVIPRYSAPRSFGGRDFIDAGWPSLPKMSGTTSESPELHTALCRHIRAAWSR
jgi:diadenosine tetraphosphate (Ap4A) HIT family hydrolase